MHPVGDDPPDRSADALDGQPSSAKPPSGGRVRRKRPPVDATNAARQATRPHPRPPTPPTGCERRNYSDVRGPSGLRGERAGTGHRRSMHVMLNVARVTGPAGSRSLNDPAERFARRRLVAAAP
jgi:hypothetical protein